MNWKNRILNKTTLISLIGVAIYFFYKLFSLLGLCPDAQQFKDTYELLECIILGLALAGIITDPNSPGITDGGEHKQDDNKQN